MIRSAASVWIIFGRTTSTGSARCRRKRRWSMHSGSLIKRPSIKTILTRIGFLRRKSARGSRPKRQRALGSVTPRKKCCAIPIILTTRLRSCRMRFTRARRWRKIFYARIPSIFRSRKTRCNTCATNMIQRTLIWKRNRASAMQPIWGILRRSFLITRN